MAYWRQYYHLVWATKAREPFILPEIEGRLYSYIVSKGGKLGTYIYAINGWYDHVHLVIAIPPSLSTAKVVQHLKGASAHYINHVVTPDYHFMWQRGYGSLTVGEQKRSIAEAYVNQQKTHHTEQSTNLWLEYCTALDEGPPAKGMEETVDASFIREDGIPYEDWGPPPF